MSDQPSDAMTPGKPAPWNDPKIRAIVFQALLVGAVVMVGFCDGIDEAPSMLVVDNQTMEGCALTPQVGELQPFYKEVNGLAVWEVSPGGEPKLLDAVQSCQQ